MTNIVINYQFCKKITTLCGARRILLLFLQQQLEAKVRVNPLICASNRNSLAKHVRTLAALKIDIETKDWEKKCVKITQEKVFDNLSYHRGVVTYKFSEASQKLLKTKQYFKINLEVYTKLRSQKSKLFYELLCQFQSTRNVGQFSSNFKKNIGVANKTPKNASSFEKLVLRPIIEEIEAKTAFRIERDRDGKVAIRIRKFVYFCFSQVKEKETPTESLQYTSLYERLTQKGIPCSIAREALEKLGEKYLNRLCYCVELDRSDGKIESKLKVLMAKISKALSLIEANANKKRKRIELKKNPKRLKKKVEKNPTETFKARPNLAKQSVYKRTPDLVYYTDYKGAEGISAVLSGIIPNRVKR